MARQFKYVPDGKVLNEFFWDRSPVSIIQGPIGSGTSTACCFRILRTAMEQAPDQLGYRRTRWLVVRNTYNDLKQTTLRTWKYWFEQIAKGSMGEVKMTNPPTHDISIRLSDNSMVEMEVIFLALDQDDDVRKLLSLEVTGIWFNELQFIEKAIFDSAHSRAMQGRYPPKLDGGPTWKGVFGDMNAPQEGHWVPYMRGDVPLPDDWDDDLRFAHKKPHDWKFFVQPPGLIEVMKDGKVVGYEDNPDAENLKWLDTPYSDLVGGKTKAWIDTFVMNRVGFYQAGKPVFPAFRPEIHVAKEPLQYVEGAPLIVGVDFARNPAAVMGQVIRGRVFLLDEYGMDNVSANTFAPMLKQRIQSKFPGAQEAGIQMWGDPTGDSMGQGTDLTPYMIFRSHGLNVNAAPGNNSISVRIEAVDSLLGKMIDGSPAFLMSPKMITLKAGMAGGYHYARVQGKSRYHDLPNKDRYADFADALQYFCLGAGFGFAALNPSGKAPKPARVARKRFSLVR